MKKIKEGISKNYKIILAIISVLFIILLGILIGFFLYNSKDKTEIKNETFPNLLTSFSSEYEYLALTEAGEYYISNATQNISFDITEGTTYSIVDENNKKVEVQQKELSIVNNKGYEKGKTYTLTIDNGSFTSEKLKETKVVKFKIARDESKHYKYNEGVKKTTKEKTNIVNNQLITKESYKKDDVVTVYEGEKIVEAYVIKEKIGDNIYEVENAAIDQIFSELDFYYKETADLSNYETLEAIEEYIIADAKSSHWYDFLIKEVHALPKISIQFNKVENGLEANVTVEISAGDKSIFLNSKYHNFAFSYTIVFQAETLVDITLTNWDAQIKFKMQQNFDLNIDNSSLDYNMKGDKGFLENLKKAIEEDKKRDISEKEIEIVNIPIPIVIPVLSIDIEVSLVNQLNMSMDLDAGLGLATEIIVGFDYGVGETFKPLGAFDYKISDLTASFSGSIEDKLGIKLGVQLSFVGVVEAGIICTGGVYGSAKLAMTEDVTNNEFKADATIELGAFIELGLEAELGSADYTLVILDKTFPFYNDGWNYVYNYKNNQSQTIIKEEKNEESKNRETTSEETKDENKKEENQNTDIPVVGKSVKITFDSNGGSKVSSQTISIGQKAKKTNNPTREWYEFIEWTLDGESYDFNKPVTKDITLKASWKDKLACTFDGEMVDGAEYINGKYKYIYNKECVGSFCNKTKVDGWSVKVAEKYYRGDLTTNLCRTINGKPIVSMADMFAYTTSQNLDISSFDTSKVYNMAGMFRSADINVDLCKLDTSNVTDMHEMFNWSEMESINASCLNTKKVTNMEAMFELTAASNIDLTSFDTSNVTNMQKMFANSHALTIDVSSFNTSKVKEFDFMFSRSAATTIKGLENFDTSNATSLAHMFSYSPVTSLNLSSFNTVNAWSMDQMFASTTNLKELDLTSFTVPYAPYLDYWGTIHIFSWSNIEKVYVSNVEVADKFRESLSEGNTIEIIVR